MEQDFTFKAQILQNLLSFSSKFIEEAPDVDTRFKQRLTDVSSESGNELFIH